MVTNNVLNDIQEAIARIAFEAVRAIQYIMESEKGINDKVNANTLVDSDIYNQIEYNVDDKFLIDILINSYIDNIESGRKPFAKRVPIEDLIIWCNKKGIQAGNGIVYAIQDSIYKFGISPRPIMVYAFERWDEMWNQSWADEITNEILAPITDFFNN